MTFLSLILQGEHYSLLSPSAALPLSPYRQSSLLKNVKHIMKRSCLKSFNDLFLLE